MIIYYSLIGADGFIELSQFTSNSDYVVKPESNKRFLLDNPPSFNPLLQKIVRVEPIPLDATEVPYIVSDVSFEVKMGVYSGAIQKALDDFAKTRKYDNIISACSYAVSNNVQRQSEGQYCVNLRDVVWDIASELEAEIVNGTKQEPASVEEVLAMLPVMQWPA